MAYACIKIELNKVIVAVIPKFELSKSTEELRNRINDDQLVEGQFSFVAVPNKPDENNTKVEDIVSDDECEESCESESSNRRVVIVKLLTTDESNGDNNWPQGETLHGTAGDIAPNVSASRQTPEKNEWKTHFHYQFSHQIKGLKMYTDQQIKKARGMRSDYFKFWNERVKELCREMPGASRKKIIRQIEEDWRKKQSAILNTEAAFFEKNHCGKKPDGLKPGTLNKNLQAIQHEQRELLHIEEQLQKKGNSAVVKKRLIANKQRARSQLKRAQETMRKNLNKKKTANKE